LQSKKCKWIWRFFGSGEGGDCDAELRGIRDYIFSNIRCFENIGCLKAIEFVIANSARCATLGKCGTSETALSNKLYSLSLSSAELVWRFGSFLLI